MVFPGSHREQTLAQGRHAALSIEYANAADRIAGSPTSAGVPPTTAEDIGKIARQTDDDTFYIVASIGPLVWNQIDAEGGGAVDSENNILATQVFGDGRR